MLYDAVYCIMYQHPIKLCKRLCCCRCTVDILYQNYWKKSKVYDLSDEEDVK